MTNCIIIDDEPLALKVLADHINKIPDLNLVGQFFDPISALQTLNSDDIDLLFLDIHMPDINGIEFYSQLTKKPSLILTTAYPDHALKGFEINAIDYLVKPITFEKFFASFNKALSFIQTKKSKYTFPKEYFFLNASHKIHKVYYNDILYLEGFKDYTKIHFANLDIPPLLILKNLKYFEDLLAEHHFIRIHKSYIVSIRHILVISSKSVELKKISLPISNNYKDALINLIKEKHF